MFRFEIPGRETIEIESIVFDYNGTIALDGKLLTEVAALLPSLAAHANLYVLTADTHGTVREECKGLPVTVKTFPRADAAGCKEEIVRDLGAGVACIGNGFNDILMFDCSDLSIAVFNAEGMCGKLLAHADVFVPSIVNAMELFLIPDRLKATLRS